MHTYLTIRAEVGLMSVLELRLEIFDFDVESIGEISRRDNSDVELPVSWGDAACRSVPSTPSRPLASPGEVANGYCRCGTALTTETMQHEVPVGDKA